MVAADSTWTDARLEPTRFGPVQWFAAVDSTNRVLLEAAARGAAEGAVAVADEQTAGRGRLGRTWVAPPGASLLVSVLLRPRLEPERLGLVTLAAGVAAIAAVGRVAGIAAQLKWPNDLVVDDRKLAGILAEKDGGAVVVGMGLNVAWDAFPPDIAATATACNLLTTTPVARDELLVAWLIELDRRLDALDATIAEARAHSATVGRRVRVDLVRESFEADAIGITDAGLLLVRRDDGRELALSAGDVVHLRAEG